MTASAQYLCHDRILARRVSTRYTYAHAAIWHLEIAKGNTILWIVRFAEEKVPQAEFLGLAFQFLNDGNNSLPTRLWMLWKLSVRYFEGRFDLILKSWLGMNHGLQPQKTHLKEVNQLGECFLSIWRELVLDLSMQVPAKLL